MRSRNPWLTLGFLTVAGGGIVATNHLNPLQREISVDLKQGEIRVPVYHQTTGVKPFRCSTYARRAAERIFGLTYSFSDAWDRIHNDRLVTRVDEFSDLERLVDHGEMQPGMIVGIQVPRSIYADRIDTTGNRVLFTHNALYLGENRQGIEHFAHQNGSRTEVVTIRDLENLGWKPRAVLTPNQ